MISNTTQCLDPITVCNFMALKTSNIIQTLYSLYTFSNINTTEVL